MSHDRGCHVCFEDPCSYRSCKDPECPKKDLVAHLDREKREKAVAAYERYKSYEEKLFLVEHLKRQLEFSERTFGPGERTVGIVNHIAKELNEVLECDGGDIMEWIDIIILAFDGALRKGFTPQQIADALVEKQTINENRKWPDWRQFTNGEPIEHIE